MKILGFVLSAILAAPAWAQPLDAQRGDIFLKQEPRREQRRFEEMREHDRQRAQDELERQRMSIESERGLQADMAEKDRRRQLEPYVMPTFSRSVPASDCSLKIANQARVIENQRREIKALKATIAKLRK